VAWQHGSATKPHSRYSNTGRSKFGRGTLLENYFLCTISSLFFSQATPSSSEASPVATFAVASDRRAVSYSSVGPGPGATATHKDGAFRVASRAPSTAAHHPCARSDGLRKAFRSGRYTPQQASICL